VNGLLSNFARIVHTAAPLRPMQWWYLPLRRLQPAPRVAIRRHEFDATGALQMVPVLKAWARQTGGTRVQSADDVLEGRFTFQRVTREWNTPPWMDAHVSPLWTFHLHYFDFALDLAAAFELTRRREYLQRFEQLVTSWMDNARPGRNVAWHPYTTSLRSVNWIYSILLLGEHLDPGVRARMVESLGIQLDVLSRRLERHLLANHLQRNLKALIVGGMVMPRTGRAWLELGLREIWSQLYEQVGPDGVHFERSPSYHAVALADFLELVVLLGDAVPADARARVADMVDAYGALSRPDGSLHLFNDCANDAAPPRDWLGALSRLALSKEIASAVDPIVLPNAGYYGFAADNGDRLLVDCGELGPSYQPAHGHCDLLSFEYDVAGVPIVVDSGVSGYEGDPLRGYMRSTRAHNTVMIGGQEQSDLWSTFRAAARATPRAARSSGNSRQFRFEGSYSPYHNARMQHHRTLVHEDGDLTITDRVANAAEQPLTSFLHFHPDCHVVSTARGIAIERRGVRLHLTVSGVDSVRIVKGDTSPAQGWHAAEFGAAQPAFVVEMNVHSNDGREFGYHLTRAAA
jgi:hypothetical protein